MDGCLYCEGERPNGWIFTRLSPPTTVYSCEQDIAPNLIGVLATVLEVDYARLYTAVEKFMAAEEKRHAKEVDRAAQEIEAAGGFAADPADDVYEEGSDAVSAG